VTLAMHATAGAHVSGRWSFGLLFLLFSLVVLAEKNARLDIVPTDDDDRLTDEIYNSATGWRTATVYENEWRRGTEPPASRIQFGYDSAYEEMPARNNNFGPDTDHPKNTQLRIGF
jgi:hypothetical protein